MLIRERGSTKSHVQTSWIDAETYCQLIRQLITDQYLQSNNHLLQLRVRKLHIFYTDSVSLVELAKYILKSTAYKCSTNQSMFTCWLPQNVSINLRSHPRIVLKAWSRLNMNWYQWRMRRPTLGSVIQEQMLIIQISKNPFTNLAFDYPVTTMV